MAALRTLSCFFPLGMGLEEVLEEEVALSGELMFLNSPSELSDSEPRPLLLFKDILVSVGLAPFGRAPFARARSRARTRRVTQKDNIINTNN